MILGGIDTTRGEGHGESDPGSLGSLLDGGSTTEDDEISQRHLLAAGVELGLDSFQLEGKKG